MPEQHERFAHPAARRRLILPLIAVQLFVTAGCQFIDLGRDLKEMEKFTYIEGTITVSVRGTRPF